MIEQTLAQEPAGTVQARAPRVLVPAQVPQARAGLDPADRDGSGPDVAGRGTVVPDRGGQDRQPGPTSGVPGDRLTVVRRAVIDPGAAGRPGVVVLVRSSVPRDRVEAVADLAAATGWPVIGVLECSTGTHLKEKS